MKNFISTSLLSLCLVVSGFSQSKPYFTSGAEFIFAFGNIDQSGAKGNSLLRFTPVINLQAMINKDVSEKFGLFSGLAVRSVGYRMDDYKNPEDNLLYKKMFRSYNFGIPVGFKFGNLDKFFLYAGYEGEVGITYKEKTFDGGDKIDKITGWFSNRQNLFQHGFLVGVQLPYGGNLKFKYYLSEFHNRDFVTTSGVKPYANLDTHVFYFSLNFFLFKNTDVYIYK
jgi:hypothetical protein